MRSPRRVAPCGRRASCDWMVEIMGGAPCRQGLSEVCHRVLHHVNNAIAADLCSFALVTDDRAGGRVLSGVVFRSNNDDSYGQSQPKWDRYIMEYVIETGRSLNIMDVIEDTRFSPEVGEISGSRPKSILSLPVYNPREELVGIVMAINKTTAAGMNYGQHFFSEEDEKVLATHMGMLGVILDNAQLCENVEQESKRSQVLLELARLLSETHDSRESLLNKMASTILPITRAKLCTVFIADSADKASFAYVIDTENMGPDGNETLCKRECDVNKISLAYAVHVKNTLETLNVANISTDCNTTEEAGDKMRTLVCTPVRNGREGKVIGVCQLVNKQSEGACRAEVFGRGDERLLEDFALYCGLGLQNYEIQQKAQLTRAQQEVTREVLSYHISASEEEIMTLQESSIPSAQTLSLLDFSFSDFGLPDSVTTQATVRMFLDLNLVQDFNIDYKSLCRWVLSVRRGYRRDVAYHNWHHALSTAQCMFAMLKATSHLQKHFSSLEILALMIATLCHDLDHRGVNNSYIARSQQPLAQLYGHSSLEHHHYDLCVLILNNPGSEILSGLSQEDYRRCLLMVEKSILATDLALYMKRRDTFFQLAERETLSWQDQEHRELLSSMLMTASDICAITKPWPVQKRTASLIASEFFAQGDREKNEFNIRPIAVMNRENSTRVPHMQMEYIDGICAPLYKALAGMFDSCNPLFEGCMKNHENWQRLAQGEEDEVFATDG
ncbi:cGMP-specific 3',5'-cyclic phosphodiesterase [Alosa pseudoharengus]|uniref:cGMP-specific 3',5'-cyclic phosphodiesterase n=1 Tax=Alosa pseudoharengus TaxID=34774 RepID=UPI003F8AE213